MRPSLTRRRFLRSSGALAVAALSPFRLGRANDRPSASERITVGLVGCGSRGFNLLNDFLREPDAQVVAVCDAHDLHYRDRVWGTGAPMGRTPAQKTAERHYARSTKSGQHQGITATADYRELIQRDDIDAIIIATPDHWHARCTLEALQAGKDVYCEKPVTHLFAEGMQVVDEVKKQQAIFQTGSQQRSEDEFRQAVEIVRNGVLGKLQRIEVGLPPGYDSPQGDTTITDPPNGLDYDLWCGPAPKLPYMRARHHRWWRGHRAYGGGVLMDWIGHHNDIAHWSMDMDSSGPTRVEAVHWTFPETEVYDTPFHYTIQCEYPNGVTSTISDSLTLGTKWIGEDGWLFVTRGKIEASNTNWLKESFDPGPFQPRESPGHARDFLNGVKSRQECIAPAETAHRSITPGHLAYVSQALGRPLQWDPQTQSVVQDEKADRLLKSTEYRDF